MENKEKETFQYTYSAKQQEEIKNIRKKYVEPEEDKMEQLRRLDNGVTQKATVVSLITGIIGALIMGSGMSLILTEWYKKLGEFEIMGLLIGIVLGILGIVLVCLAYPLYNRAIKKEREKIAPEIIKLTDELMKP